MQSLIHILQGHLERKGRLGGIVQSPWAGACFHSPSPFRSPLLLDGWEGQGSSDSCQASIHCMSLRNWRIWLHHSVSFSQTPWYSSAFSLPLQNETNQNKFFHSAQQLKDTYRSYYELQNRPGISTYCCWRSRRTQFKEEKRICTPLSNRPKPSQAINRKTLTLQFLVLSLPRKVLPKCQAGLYIQSRLALEGLWEERHFSQLLNWAFCTPAFDLAGINYSDRKNSLVLYYVPISGKKNKIPWRLRWVVNVSLYAAR